LAAGVSGKKRTGEHLDESSDAVWIRRMFKGFPQAWVNWLGKKGVQLRVGTRTYLLQPGSPVIHWDGGLITLSKKVALKNAKTWVAPELFPIVARHAEESQVASKSRE